MGVIQILPPSVVNQIAAGEVVERPSSVVKEMMENAIDAGAKRLEVSVERGGKDLIRIADDGQGIAAEDLLLAFQPHATSKLQTADDLHRVRTLGFRGEALAAIAEISKVRCQTRRADADEGSELQIEGGIAAPIKGCGGPVGTVMEVRNLFFNTPVRRTFLKSDSTEAGHVAETFARIALAHPQVQMTFRSGGKVVHDLPAVAGIRERVATFFGRELAESLLWVEGKLDQISLWGYVGHPSQSRSSTKSQYLFLGGRYVRDRSLSHALNEAYRGLLMVGRNPVAFLNLEIPAEEVDVNVHPTKIEVRFRDPQRIYSHLLSTLRQTFLSSDLHSRLQAVPAARPSSEAPHAASPSVAPSSGWSTAAPSAQPAPSIRPESPYGLESEFADRQAVASWFQPSHPPDERPQIPDSVGQVQPPEWSRTLPGRFDFADAGSFDEFSRPPVEAGSGLSSPSEPSPIPDPPRAERRVEPQAMSTGHAKAIQVHDSYLIAETNEGMMVIDQHALHERILYEELRKRVAEGRVESQGLLVPEPVHMAADEAAILLEHAGLLAELGLEVEGFGGDTVLVRSTPVMLSQIQPDQLVRDLAEHLSTQPLPPTRDGLVAELLHMVSCKAAVKAGQKLNADEIEALLARRELAADAHHCPHGRPTALIFTKSELEKQFGRI
ncbi:DNA mismatch repair endonuclease MutL [Planctomyces sp. SH-PL62]|uniref:DNA mismatch repair endonuclease MutL n=1 Tax=Planctomyces sp. SH-PL62 TaxID=1636152 RepID=UPI00078D2404|nr:DNA mismatch repair endonuclease MutL [Planctomyces sp. SH-PL62]AMV39166.1 DNA mismatch repair protein MutL [Planctomyces sp. SH-PL62]